MLVVSGYAGYKAYQWKRTWEIWLFVALAILFNPIIPVTFAKEVWQVLDVIVAFVFGLSLILVTSKKEERTKLPDSDVTIKELKKTKSCPYCGNSVAVDILKCPECGKYAQKCVNHPRRQAVDTCVECGKFLCRECSGEGEGDTYCPECFENLSDESHKAEKSGTVTLKIIQERNWFKKHLNWTAYFSSFITSPLLALVAQGWRDSFINGSVNAIVIFLTLVTVCIFIPIWVWLLRSKERSLWWLLLVPVNYIMAYYLYLWSIIIPNFLLVCYFFMSNKTLDVYRQPEDNTEPES